MRYRAVPLAGLLEDLTAGDQLQTLGFAIELPATPLLAGHDTRAWQAVEAPAESCSRSTAWPAIGSRAPATRGSARI